MLFYATCARKTGFILGIESQSAFVRYIGIDYLGAETPNSSLKGLRVYLADRALPSEEVLPPPSPRKYWTRRGIGVALRLVAKTDPHRLWQH